MFTVSCNVHQGEGEGSACGWWPAEAPDVQGCLGLVLCCKWSEELATGHTLRDLGSRWRLTVHSVQDKLLAIKDLQNENIKQKKTLA